MDKRACLYSIFDLGLERLYIVQCHVVTDVAVFDKAVRTDGTLGTDLGLAS